MPRGRKRACVELDYDALIAAAEEKISKLSEDLKAEKANLKKLKKDKDAWELEKAKKEEEAKQEEIIKIISASGKSLDEIKAMLSEN